MLLNSTECSRKSSINLAESGSLQIKKVVKFLRLIGFVFYCTFTQYLQIMMWQKFKVWLHISFCPSVICSVQLHWTLSSTVVATKDAITSFLHATQLDIRRGILKEDSSHAPVFSQEIYPNFRDHNIWLCNKVCEAVRRRTILIGNNRMKWRDLGNRLVQIS